MAIFTLDDQIDDSTELINDDIKTPVFNSDVIRDDILKQIAGYKWYVDYYNLIANLDDNQTTADFSVDLATTEYTAIKNMVVILDTPISTDIAVDMTGSGYINANIIPKNGDVFIAKLIDGRLGVFSLTSVNRKNYNLKDIFLIEFKLYSIITNTEDNIYLSLINKTVNNLIYNKDYLKTSDKPLFTTQEYEDRITIKKYLKVLTSFYNSKVVNKDVKNYIAYMNTKSELIYDPNVEYFVKEVIGISNLNNNINILGKRDESIYTLLDIILSDIDSIMINKYIKLVPTSDYGTNPYNNTMYWSGVRYVVNAVNIKNDLIEENDVTNNNNYPFISNLYYMFDSMFYDTLLGTLEEDTEVSLTLLELIVINIIHKEPIKISDIKTVMYDLINSDNKLEQYYYIPILIYSLFYYNNQITYNNI